MKYIFIGVLILTILAGQLFAAPLPGPVAVVGDSFFAAEMPSLKRMEGNIEILRWAIGQLTIQFYNILVSVQHESVSIEFKQQLQAIMQECLNVLNRLQIQVTEKE